ncbi:MAG: molybdopterin biosynthesis protein [Candidatus Bathyarchaeota archaeon]|nr:MAG: molybdopterin biosynthesis protein [Candidatus Bathyarchaeota archaeon]
MKRKIFRSLVSVDEAKRRLKEHFIAAPVGIEELPLDKCVGRILAEDVEAKIDVPPFDRASKDGFAVLAEDTFLAEEDRPIALQVGGKIVAGDDSSLSVDAGKAIEISTGAPIPKGANAVVMVEYTWRTHDEVKIYRPVVPGENIMAAGSDIMAGELILRKDTFLTPRETGVLAALGRILIKVTKKPVVAVISTGNEIVSPGRSLEYGKIYDINARTIADSIVESGGVPTFFGIVRDDMAALLAMIRESLQTTDMVILSGGTSAGIGDFLYRVINAIGKPGILVHGVTVRPGKPLIIAVVNGKPIFGLPGFPSSALMMFNVFIRPLLKEMAGLKPEDAWSVEAKTGTRIYSAFGRHEYRAVNLVRNESSDYVVYPVPGGSGALTTLTEADGFIEIHGNRTVLEEGEPVHVTLFSTELTPADLYIIGSHCIGIDFILALWRRCNPAFTSKVIKTGSSGGLTAIRRSEADIAGIHLLDPETLEYNRPFIHRYGIAEKAILVRGYVREQGLIVAQNNPKQIQGVEDLWEKDVYLINRNRGSGTRILLDTYLHQITQKKEDSRTQPYSRIKGYGAEAKSHTAVAVAILHGKADVGIAIRTVAHRYGLDFLPLTTEHYDFVINKKRLSQSPVQAFLAALRSKRFTTELAQALPGLAPVKDTGTIIYP